MPTPVIVILIIVALFLIAFAFVMFKIASGNKKKEFEKKCQEFMARISKLGVSTAQEAFGSSISVNAQPIKNGFKIVASGEAIGFLEFGAGTMTNSTDMFAGQVTYDVSPGSWSRSPMGSGEFERTGRWEFPPGSGRYLEFVEPRAGMQKAYEAIIRDARSIAKEEFK